MRTELFFPESPFLVLLSVVVGLLFAAIMYFRSKEFDQRLRALLAILRGLAVALVCFLILGPLIRSVRTVQEKARAIILIDNSASLAPFSEKVRNAAAAYGTALRDAGYDVGYRLLDGGETNSLGDSINFLGKSTDITAQLDAIRTDFEGMHLTDVFLLSDGIVNKGISPVYGFYPFKVNTVAIGDTIPYIGVQIKNVTVNQVAYLGNNFPIAVDVAANEMAGKSSSIVLKQGNTVIASQRVDINQNQYFKTFTFTHAAENKGIQHYTLEISGIEGEHSLKNNRKEIFIDVIDGREKILLLARAPHPDIKALKAILDKNQNLEVDIQIASSVVNYNQLQNTPYDLVILHQLPDINGTAKDFITKISSTPVPLLLIAGEQSFYRGLTDLSKSVQFPNTQGQTDRVTGIFNSAFNLVNLNEEALKLLERLPPLLVPFGDYNLTADTEVVLYQKIGSLKTQKPLLTVSKGSNKKTGVLAGEGLWRWRLEEYALTGKQEIVDELIQKTVQYLSVKEDKRKFRVYPSVPEFELGEKAVLQTEIYNDIYEQVYGQEISLEILTEDGRKSTYNYIHTAEKPYFEISNLTQGVFHYIASTTISNQKEEVSGQFIIKESDLELSGATADFGMLRELALKTNGTFGTLGEQATQINAISGNRPPDKLKSNDNMYELIELRWLFFVLLLLIACEWGIRKYNGQY